MSELDRIRRRRLGLHRTAARIALSEALADLAFDIRQMERQASGVRVAAKRERERQAQRRVNALLVRDREDRLADAMREAAIIEIEEGRFLHIGDTVIPPTPEWLAKGESLPFTPTLPENARNEVANPPRTSRRVQCVQAYRQMRAGVIDFEGYRACCWYDDLHEATGTVGACATTDYEKEVFASPQARAAFTEAQCEAQGMFARVRHEIAGDKASDGRFVAFLDLVVVGDVPLHRATRRVSGFRARPHQKFAFAVEKLVDVKNSIEAD